MVVTNKSIIDLTALLDVILILFFAALLNIALKAETIDDKRLDLEEKNVAYSKEIIKLKRENNRLQKSLLQANTHLAQLYNNQSKSIEDYREIVNRISIIKIGLKGEDNQLYINDEVTGIYIVKESLATPERKLELVNTLKNALESAIYKRQKSDILFIQLVLLDDDVYKYAYDLTFETAKEVIATYGKDKVIFAY